MTMSFMRAEGPESRAGSVRRFAELSVVVLTRPVETGGGGCLGAPRGPWWRLMRMALAMRSSSRSRSMPS